MRSGSLPPGWRPAAARRGGVERPGTTGQGARCPRKEDTGSAPGQRAQTQTSGHKGATASYHASTQAQDPRPPEPQEPRRPREGDAPTSPALAGSAQGLSPHGLGSARPPAPQPSPQPAPCSQLSRVDCEACPRRTPSATTSLSSRSWAGWHRAWQQHRAQSLRPTVSLGPRPGKQEWVSRPAHPVPSTSLPTALRSRVLGQCPWGAAAPGRLAGVRDARSCPGQNRALAARPAHAALAVCLEELDITSELCAGPCHAAPLSSAAGAGLRRDPGSACHCVPGPARAPSPGRHTSAETPHASEPGRPSPSRSKPSQMAPSEPLSH